MVCRVSGPVVYVHALAGEVAIFGAISGNGAYQYGYCCHWERRMRRILATSLQYTESYPNAINALDGAFRCRRKVLQMGTAPLPRGYQRGGSCADHGASRDSGKEESSRVVGTPQPASHLISSVIPTSCYVTRTDTSRYHCLARSAGQRHAFDMARNSESCMELRDREPAVTLAYCTAAG